MPTPSPGTDDVSIVRRLFDVKDDPPLVLLQHFRPDLRSWDPAGVDDLGRHCDVALFDNGRAEGPTAVDPGEVVHLVDRALAFIDGLRLRRIDLLGFSLGGHVARGVVLRRPLLVRRLVLAAVAPKDDPDLHLWADGVHFLTNPVDRERELDREVYANLSSARPTFVPAQNAPSSAVIPLISHSMALRAGATAQVKGRASPGVQQQQQ